MAARKPFIKKAWIIGALRKASYRYPPRYKAKNASKIGRNQYTCSTCHGVFGTREVQLDHLVPVVGPDGFVDWNSYIERMFCDEEGFAVVCKPCHQIKTQAENKERRNVRNRKKVA